MLSSEVYTNTTTATATAVATATSMASTACAASSSTMNAFSTLHVVRTKKRRKRRKRAGHATGCGQSNGGGNGVSSSSNPAKAIVGCGRKCKAQYFQHDNREYIAKYESFHITAQATTAAALNYAAVAKKFKPVLASGAKKNRRTAMSRKTLNDCACVCQNTQMTQCPQEVRTADDSQRERQRRERERIKSDSTRNLKGQALPALLELLKHSSSTWLETLLLGAGKAAVAR
ncbi:uncharacterized protein Dvir_GJ26972 [Drosophila virilis]|uniref:Uncharacterized protein n=1 Tax=Drosophila virilis TaxID=7244 RepID=A0A0Q9WUX6_DROVI|nr:uncharacterized protein Dvir_GJ26972 [Drosophila virilis]